NVEPTPGEADPIAEVEPRGLGTKICRQRSFTDHGEPRLRYDPCHLADGIQQVLVTLLRGEPPYGEDHKIVRLPAELPAGRLTIEAVRAEGFHLDVVFDDVDVAQTEVSRVVVADGAGDRDESR